MSNAFSHLRRAAVTLLLSASLGACVVYTPYGPDDYVGGAVAVAPPAPIAETYGPAPVAGYVWLGGYWNWVGGQHVWVRGHWEAPRAGYRWVPHAWVHRSDGWHLGRGHWARR
jgi:hypothetical protein